MRGERRQDYRQPRVVLPTMTAAQHQAFEIECRIEIILETWDAMGTDWPLLYEHARAEVLHAIAADGKETGDADGRSHVGEAL